MDQARSFIKTHRLLLLAIFLCLSFHGGMVFWTFRGTYDAWVHIFFADHWSRSLFDHWNPRWYTGFSMVSYPPGSQQTVGILSKLVGLESAFAIIQLFAITLCTIGIYRFSKIWTNSPNAPGYAALYFVFSSSVVETIHVFGQLPTIFSLGFLLNTIPFMMRWLRKGELSLLIIALIWSSATTGGHHVTTLFGAVFFVAPVMVLALVEALQTPLDGESAEHPSVLTWRNLRPLIWRRVRRVLPTTLRCGVFGVGMIAMMVIVVLPYWIWSITDPITQVPIPHASRDSFLENTAAGIIFWIIPYGVSLMTLPYIFYKGFTSKAWPLALSLSLLFVLGTGGTTPIPKLLLGEAFDILTLDRFTFWATICLTPLVGEFISSLVEGRIGRFIMMQFGAITLHTTQFALLASFLGFALFTASLTQLRSFQPDPIDMDPIVRFIEKDEHWKWRYLTLGFGDQVAWLGAQTSAVSVDGNYHSARRLPELTTTPVERLEGAKFRGIPGIGSLQQFLAVPEKYRLKFVFSNDQFYDPLLYFSGWHRIGRLENGIMVWERADIPALPEELPRKEIPDWQKALFGILPVGFLVLALIVGTSHLLKFGSGIAFALELTGITALSRWLLRPLTQPAQWLWKKVDGTLARWSVLREPADGSEAWWYRLLTRIRQFDLPKEGSVLAKFIRSAVLLCVVMIVGYAAFNRLQQVRHDPIRLIEAYYDDLDFRRFSNAYARLDPDLAQPFDEWLLGQNSVGGILASYAKLNSIHTRIIEEEPDWMLVEVNLDWISSLSAYHSTETVELNRQDNYRWAIVPPLIDAKQTPDTFYRQSTIAWQVNPPPRPEQSVTAFTTIEDRPELQILSSRLVREDGRYYVVGELINLDVDPADVTLTAQLFNQNNDLISWYNAQKMMKHKIFPKEITPFRVDFEGVAGLQIEEQNEVGTFHPDDFSPITLAQPIHEFVIQAKAVVTPYDLHRDVGVQQLRVESRELRNGNHVGCSSQPSTCNLQLATLHGTLINNGTVEAIVPQVLVTYYNYADEVVWVDGFFIEEGIRPQKEFEFELPLKSMSTVEPVDDEGVTFTNLLDGGVLDDFGDSYLWAERLTVPKGLGFASIRVSVNYFVASGG